MERRDFCVHACQVATLAALGLLTEACGSPSSPSGSDTSSPALTVVVGTSAGNVFTVNVAGTPLANVGGAALVQVSSGQVLAVRASQDTFNAMSAVCTHEGCTITRFASPNFLCECHGSQFNSNGGVVKGPATRSLQRFNATFANGVLTIAT